MSASERRDARIEQLERMVRDIQVDCEYYAAQYANTQQVARAGRDRIAELEQLLQKATEKDELRSRISQLELAVGTAKRDGWHEAFSVMDPVFHRIESALHCVDSADFTSLMVSAMEEYAKFVPDFVLDGRDYLTAVETAKRLRIGRDRLRDIPRRELDYVIRGEGSKKVHRRYAKADVLKYSARLERQKRGKASSLSPADASHAAP